MPFLPFIPFQDCVDVFWDFIQQGVPWAVTMTIKANSSVDSTVLNNLFDILDTWWGTDMRSLISSNVTLRGIKLSDLTSQTGPTLTLPPTSASGTLTGSVLPAQTAMVVSLATAKRGRSFRGRNYWAGRVFLDQSTVTQWNSSTVTAFATAYANLLAGLGAGGFTLGVASRYNNGVRRTVGEFNAVQTYTPKAPIATQRRRLL